MSGSNGPPKKPPIRGDRSSSTDALNLWQTLWYEQGRTKMRNINPAALAKILEREGTDPITLVQIFWDEQTYVIYGDRAFLPEIKGQLLDLGEIENVINASQGSNSGSVNIRLNDTDGSLKTIHDSMDIHKRPVYILQWFPEIPLKDAFIVFDGVISSPIVWKEGERTLSFDILTKIEDLEVGYSAEEGNFEYIPPNMIGQAWPFLFGTVLRVPALRINDIPEGYTLDDTGIDGTGQTQGDSVLANIAEAERKNISLLMELERQCFTMAAILLGQAYLLDSKTVGGTGGLGGLNVGGLHGGGTVVQGGDSIETAGINMPGAFTRKSDNPVAQQLYDLGSQYEAKGNEYLQERMRPINASGFTDPERTELEKNAVRIEGGSKFPQKTNIIITINGAQHEGYFEGDIFHIVSRTYPFANATAVVAPTEVIDRAVATEYKTDLGVQTFFYAIAGSSVGISTSNYPVYYIVGIPHVTVTAVFAKKRSKGSTKFVVPATYYGISYANFTDLKVTILSMSRPLSSRGEDWDDEIWCSCVSPIGPNAVNIMEYLITHYTNQSFDVATFNEVKTLVAPYKCGFALTERKNALQILEEIAYQSRCAIWFKGGRFFLKYLPKQGAPVTEFTEDDVESGTMEVYSTETEDVVTKWSVTWRPRVDKEPPNKIIYRYHIKKYGLIEEDYECYIYNNQNTVQKFALFWLIRKANTWKKVRFSTFMSKLAVEPFDSVLINFAFPWVNDPGCVLPTVGVVEKAAYDSETQRIQMEIWLPIRLGEMCPYDFAYPSDVDIQKIFPQENDPGVQTDIPGAGSPGQLYDQTTQTGPGGTPQTTPIDFGSGGGTTVGDAYDHSDDGAGQYNPPTELNQNDFNFTPQPPPPVTTVSQRVVKPLDMVALNVPDAVFPGFVTGKDSAGGSGLSPLSGSEAQYQVDMYENGLNRPPKKITVKQLLIHPDDEIPPGTPCLVLRNCSRDDKGMVANIFYTMQVPIWLKPKASGSTGSPADVPPSDPGSSAPPDDVIFGQDPANPQGDEQLELPL